MAIDFPTCLRFYKKQFVQRAIAELAQGREVAVKYGDRGFGKRPDTITHPGDVFEFVKKGVTSFHVSEERWEDPLRLKPGMKKREIDQLREGWDLIIDIDSKNWQISKTAAWLIVKTLKGFGIEDISVKFSGNKGFHIGLPFESFPDKVGGVKMRLLFPDLPKKVAGLIIDTIEKKHIRVEDDSVEFGEGVLIQMEDLKEMVKGEKHELFRTICLNCGSEVKPNPKEQAEFICPSCGRKEKSSGEDFMRCKRCGKLMQKVFYTEKRCTCGNTDPIRKLNILSLIDIDTLLISSRHMYRCVYSLHEKSGLASIPINPERIMDFDKKEAIPENVRENRTGFLSLKKGYEGEAMTLFEKALNHNKEYNLIIKEDISGEDKDPKTFQALEEAAPQKIFPPCILKMLKGMEDGRKRALFILTNFLLNVGWSKEDAESILKEWNKKNSEELRENVLLSHIKYHAQRKESILPPNCNNKAYYLDMGVCDPDSLCRKIKNPVSYTRGKAIWAKKEEKRKMPRKKKKRAGEAEVQKRQEKHDKKDSFIKRP